MRPRHAKFVAEYLISGNATDAAIKAGYKPSGARFHAASLLTKPNIRQAIRDHQDAASERTLLTVERVLRELMLIAFADQGDILDFSGTEVRMRPAKDIPARARRAISSIKVKRQIEGHGDDAHEVEVIEYKLCDKLSALDKLGKHLAMFVDPDQLKKLSEYAGEIANRLNKDTTE